MPAPIMSMLTARFVNRFIDEEGDNCPVPLPYVVLAFGDAEVAAWPIPLEEIPARSSNHQKFVECFAAARLKEILARA